MKKVLWALAVASAFAACDDAKTNTDSTTTDSTIVKVDTSAVIPVDSVNVDTAANKMKADRTKK